MQKVSKVVIHAALACLCLGCGSREKDPAMHTRHSPSDQEFYAIDGRIVDLDFVATRSSSMNSEIMRLVTAEGDTFHLFIPGDLRCKPGTSSDTAGLGRGMTIRVYLRPGNVELALKQYMPVEWAEVGCSEKRP